MVSPHLNILHLYHQNMNIYGDMGNVMAMLYRLHQRNISVKLLKCEVGEPLPSNVDIVLAGGGQDTGQFIVEDDLQQKKAKLHEWAADGVVMLAICGTYQLFGHRFTTSNEQTIKGISIFDMETKGSTDRLIGNVVIDSQFGELVGFENHSGKTFLSDGQTPLGHVLKGAGNNGDTSDEGAIMNNCFGTYMHGPLLPKNPQFTDELLGRALERKYGSRNLLTSLNDEHEDSAAAIAKTRPR